MKDHVPKETEQKQSNWMADDFPNPLRLGCNSSIFFMGNFLVTTYYILKFYECIFFSLFQLNSPKV